MIFFLLFEISYASVGLTIRQKDFSKSESKMRRSLVDGNHRKTLSATPRNLKRVKLVLPPDLYPDTRLIVRHKKFKRDFITSGLRLQRREKNFAGRRVTYRTNFNIPKRLFLIIKPAVFRNEVEVLYALPKDGWISINVYDVTGRKVLTLINSYVKAGEYRLKWNGRDSNGRTLPRGIYFLRLETSITPITKKVIFAYREGGG